MVMNNRGGLWQVLRPLLSLGALCLMPLVWGDEGCGQGARTGFALFGKHATWWVPMTLLIACAADFIGRRIRPAHALVGHLMAFLSMLYLALSSAVHAVFLHRARFPAPLATLLLIGLFADCARTLGQAIYALGRDPGDKSDLPPSPLHRVLSLVVPILFAVLVIGGLLVSPRHIREPEPTIDAKNAVAKIGPPLPMPFADAKLIELVSDRNAPTRGKLPITPPSPMWRGTVWNSPRGAGFGRHHPRYIHPLPGGDFLLVYADSGLWVLETKSLVRRARLRTGEIATIDVSSDGTRLAYADCAPADSWKHPCDLIVLRIPEFTELHRSEIRFPSQLRFSQKGDVIASSAGHFAGVTVIPLDASKPRWSTKILSTAVAAVPISETRVAYISDGGRLAIEEKERKEALYLGAGDPPVMEFPFRLGIARDRGELRHDAARDRLIEAQQNGAQVIDAVSSEKPTRGQPLTREERDAADTRVVRNHLGEALDQRFGAKQFRYGLNVDAVRGFITAEGDVLGLSRDYVVRITRGSIMRAADFGESDSSWKTSVGRFDVLYYYETGGKERLQRIDLGTPALDKTPEPIGEFDTEDDHPPLVFSNGDRVLFRFDKEKRESIIRLPRGGKLGAPVLLPVPRISSVTTDVLSADDRFAFLTMEGSLIEITLDKAHILTTEARGARLSFDEKSRCWQIEEGGRRRLVGAGCPTR